MKTSVHEICTLCQEEVNSNAIREGVQVFCCAGCHAVFNILSSKQELDGFQSHPVFLQALNAGLISNPALLDLIHQQKTEVQGGEREKLYLEISDMWCPSCSEIIKLIIGKEKGVINCVVDYATDLAAIEYSPRYIEKQFLINKIKDLGYHPSLLDDSERKAVNSDLYLRFAIAAFCALNAMMFAYPLYATYFSSDGEDYGQLFAWLSFFVSLPVVLYSAWPIWRRFANSLKAGIFGMETLVVIGVLAAFLLSAFEMAAGGTYVYYDSMSVIIAFVLLGKIIEAKAKFSAKESLLRLTRSNPRRGRKRFPDGSLQFVLVKDLSKGDVLTVLPGEKIAVDGVVIEGEGACEESIMTGESIPVIKKEGDHVLSGTILIQGRLAYRMTNNPEESALQKIIQMVERDIGQKTVYIRAADQIVRWFVPAVIVIACLVALCYWLFPSPGDLSPGWNAWLRAMAVLLISCPCAIGIAAPTAEAHLLNGLAAMGAIVRNRGCLSNLGKEEVVLFDKTGTVTEGRYVVRAGLDTLDAEEKTVLASLASLSIHPVSCGIAKSLVREEKVNVNRLEEIVGYGLRGVANGVIYSLGSDRFFRQQGIAIPEDIVESDELLQTHSLVYFAKGNQTIARLVLGDAIRAELPETIADLKSIHTGLLSGDSEQVVASIAKQCGFNSWHARCSPLEKREIVEGFKKQGKRVCMIGDGINDAPALTAADIGISVVSAADMSIHVSDILLTTDRFTVIPKMQAFARKGQTIIRQNLFWAFFYNVIGIFLAAFGVLSPIFAAFAMSISSVTVLLNARRLS